MKQRGHRHRTKPYHGMRRLFVVDLVAPHRFPLALSGLRGEAALVLRGAGRGLGGARLGRAGSLGLAAGRHADGVAGGGHSDLIVMRRSAWRKRKGDEGKRTRWSVTTGAMMSAAQMLLDAVRVRQQLLRELSGIYIPMMRRSGRRGFRTTRSAPALIKRRRERPAGEGEARRRGWERVSAEWAAGISKGLQVLLVPSAKKD